MTHARDAPVRVRGADSGATSLTEQGSDSPGNEAGMKGVPWSEDEHRAFLKGLHNLGKGNWRGISRMFVPSRSPTQVASHAQKYFLRLNGCTKRRSRFSGLEQATKQAMPVPKAATSSMHAPPSPASPMSSADACHMAADATHLKRATAPAASMHFPVGMFPPLVLGIPPGGGPPIPMLFPPAMAAFFKQGMAMPPMVPLPAELAAAYAAAAGDAKLAAVALPEAAYAEGNSHEAVPQSVAMLCKPAARHAAHGLDLLAAAASGQSSYEERAAVAARNDAATAAAFAASAHSAFRALAVPKVATV